MKSFRFLKILFWPLIFFAFVGCASFQKNGPLKTAWIFPYGVYNYEAYVGDKNHGQILNFVGTLQRGTEKVVLSGSQASGQSLFQFVDDGGPIVPEVHDSSMKPHKQELVDIFAVWLNIMDMPWNSEFKESFQVAEQNKQGRPTLIKNIDRQLTIKVAYRRKGTLPRRFIVEKPKITAEFLIKDFKALD